MFGLEMFGWVVAVFVGFWDLCRMFWDLHRTLFPGGIPHVEEIFVNIGVFVYLLSIFHHVHPGVYMYRFILRFVFA